MNDRQIVQAYCDVITQLLLNAHRQVLHDVQSLVHTTAKAPSKLKSMERSRQFVAEVRKDLLSVTPPSSQQLQNVRMRLDVLETLGDWMDPYLDGSYASRFHDTVTGHCCLTADDLAPLQNVLVEWVGPSSVFGAFMHESAFTELLTGRTLRKERKKERLLLALASSVLLPENLRTVNEYVTLVNAHLWDAVAKRYSYAYLTELFDAVEDEMRERYAARRNDAISPFTQVMFGLAVESLEQWACVLTAWNITAMEHHHAHEEEEQEEEPVTSMPAIVLSSTLRRNRPSSGASRKRGGGGADEDDEVVLPRSKRATRRSFLEEEEDD